MAYAHQEPRRAHRVSVWDRLEYRFIVTVVFAFCLASAFIKRVTGHLGQPASYDRRNRPSVFAEARSVAHSVAGYAYQR